MVDGNTLSFQAAIDNSACNVRITHCMHACNWQGITGVAVPFGGKVFLYLEVILDRFFLWSHMSHQLLWQSLIHALRNLLFASPPTYREHPGQQEFSAWLLQLGNGILTVDISSRMPDVVEVPSSMHSWFFSNRWDLRRYTTVSFCHPKMKTASRSMNKSWACCQVKQDHISVQIATVKSDNEEERQNYPVDFPSGMPPHVLNLKVGCHFAMHAFTQKLYPGTAFQGQNSGNHVLIPRIKLAPSNANFPFTLQHYQFPLRLAYSITINKSQGQTFEKIKLQYFLIANSM